MMKVREAAGPGWAKCGDGAGYVTLGRAEWLALNGVSQQSLSDTFCMLQDEDSSKEDGELP